MNRNHFGTYLSNPKYSAGGAGNFGSVTALAHRIPRFCRETSSYYIRSLSFPGWFPIIHALHLLPPAIHGWPALSMVVNERRAAKRMQGEETPSLGGMAVGPGSRDDEMAVLRPTSRPAGVLAERGWGSESGTRTRREERNAGDLNGMGRIDVAR